MASSESHMSIPLYEAKECIEDILKKICHQIQQSTGAPETFGLQDKHSKFSTNFTQNTGKVMWFFLIITL